MELFEYIAPCHFGLEAVLKREITDLGYDVTAVENGKVTFAGDAQAAAYANVFIRTAERILLKVGEFNAETFDELFENTKALPWDEFLPKDARFWVAKANSVSSRLFSPSDIQSIMKKAMVDRMRERYHQSWFDESGAAFPVRTAIVKDRVTVGLDTTGVSLHKRGYRKATAKAPITETLAAALILLTPWKKDRILADPFCGSGTFVIEAAMMAANMAPGMHRTFLSQEWKELIDPKHFREAFEEASDCVDLSVSTDLSGFDLDPEAVAMARSNARDAGVQKLVRFRQQDVSELSHPGKFGFLITNPPYGERIGETEELKKVYRTLGERYRALDSWSLYLITALEGAEECIGRKADKNRKIYNGMMKTYFYQYAGPKPPKRKAEQ